MSQEVRAENCSDFSHMFQNDGRIVHKFYGTIWMWELSNKSQVIRSGKGGQVNDKKNSHCTLCN